MDTFGKKNEEEFVYLSDSEPKRLKQYDKRPAIILQPFDSAVDALEKELAQKIIDEIEFQERVLTKNEKEKIQKAAKLIIRAAKKMKKLMEDRPVWDYKALADAQARLYKQPHILAREAAEILDIDPLEQFQEEIIELARLYPKVIKPEKIYGDRWFEFLKKKGIDPKELNPRRKKSLGNYKTQEHASAEAQRLLGLLAGLRFAEYREEAVNNTVKDLEEKIRKITKLDYPTPEDVYRLGLYHLALSYIREGKFEKAEDVFRGL